MANAYVELPLNSARHPGLVTLIDTDDYHNVLQYSWHPLRKEHTFYAVASVWQDGRTTSLRLHKMLTGWSETDHQNHDGLDNRRCNLRFATRVLNNANNRSHRGSSSRFKGVSWYKSRCKWRAQIMIDGKTYSLGYFTHEEDAANAYRKRAKEVWGDYVCEELGSGPDN